MRARAIAAAGGGFLAAVLCLDLAFDRLALGGAPDEAQVARIAAYYAGVTGAPLARAAVGVAMAAAVGAAAWQAWRSRRTRGAWPRRVVALAAIAAPVGLALGRTLPNALALAAGKGTPEERAALARAIAHDHLACLAVVVGFVALQITARDDAGDV